jgi:hypothetical protein
MNIYEVICKDSKKVYLVKNERYIYITLDVNTKIGMKIDNSY